MRGRSDKKATHLFSCLEQPDPSRSNTRVQAQPEGRTRSGSPQSQTNTLRAMRRALRDAQPDAATL